MTAVDLKGVYVQLHPPEPQLPEPQPPEPQPPEPQPAELSAAGLTQEPLAVQRALFTVLPAALRPDGGRSVRSASEGRRPLGISPPHRAAGLRSGERSEAGTRGSVSRRSGRRVPHGVAEPLPRGGQRQGPPAGREGVRVRVRLALRQVARAGSRPPGARPGLLPLPGDAEPAERALQLLVVHRQHGERRVGPPPPRGPARPRRQVLQGADGQHRGPLGVGGDGARGEASVLRRGVAPGAGSGALGASSSRSAVRSQGAAGHLARRERLGVVEEDPPDLAGPRRVLAGLQGHVGGAGRVHLQELTVLDVHVHQEVQLLLHVLHLRRSRGLTVGTENISYTAPQKGI
ncbi:hypothetical protein EYF80_057918 [Liparis tanakae]|uniref:Uncharacterized protein n=1 Tax=Liparis tanakae TaxID=230148 RepID=A0A4Z2ET09_9TELE|nr:hypothetical protein EYF80_057918 [Liparis tanakae]